MLTTRRSIAISLSLAAALALVGGSASARSWIRSVDSGTSATVLGGFPTADGRFVVAARVVGATNDTRIVKVNVDGSVLWARVLPGGADGVAVEALAERPDGTLVLVGSAGTDLWAARVSPAGRLDWQRRYTATSATVGRAVRADASGALTVAGTIGSDGLWLRLDGAGNVIASRAFDAGATDAVAFEDVRALPDGFVLAGTSGVAGLAVRTDPNGALVWARTVDAGPLVSIVPAGSDDGLVAVAAPARLVKLSSIGDVVWQNALAGGFGPLALERHEALGADFLLSGSDGVNFWIARVTRLGFLQWDRVLRGSGPGTPGVARFASQVPAGGTFAVGESEGEVAIVRVDAMGDIDTTCLLWSEGTGAVFEETGSSAATPLSVSTPSFDVSETAFVSALGAGQQAAVCEGTEATDPSEVSPPAAFQSPLRFTDRTTLTWESLAPSTATRFMVYQGALADLAQGERYGTCVDDQVTASTITVPDEPAPGEGLFYLVRGANATGRGIAGIDTEGETRVIGLPCNVYSSCGTLQLGFECAPLFEAVDPDGFGNTIFFVQDTSGIPIGSTVFIEGESTAGAENQCQPLCPFTCIVDNTTEIREDCNADE